MATLFLTLLRLDRHYHTLPPVSLALQHLSTLSDRSIGCTAAIASLETYRDAPNYVASTNRMREFWSADSVEALSRMKGKI